MYDGTGYRCTLCVGRRKYGVGRIRRFDVVLLVSIVKRLLGAFLPLPMPTDICKLVVVLITLLANVLGLSRIGNTTSFLIRVVPIVFIPTNTKLVAT